MKYADVSCQSSEKVQKYDFTSQHLNARYFGQQMTKGFEYVVLFRTQKRNIFYM